MIIFMNNMHLHYFKLSKHDESKFLTVHVFLNTLHTRNYTEVLHDSYIHFKNSQKHQNMCKTEALNTSQNEFQNIINT